MDPIARMVAAGAAGASGSSATYVDDVFSTTLYRNDSTTEEFDNGLDMAGEGGLIVTKFRDSNSNWAWVDSERPINKVLKSNLQDQEATESWIDSFDSDGFTHGDYIGTGDNSGVVSWSFRKQPGFFDVVKYSGQGASGNLSIPHNLGTVPGMIIVKSTSHSSTSWYVYHRSLGATKYLRLDANWKENDDDGPWYDTEPTDTHFTLGNWPDVSWGGREYVAYLFAHDVSSFGANEDESIIKCGSYTGNGNNDGPEIDLGFEPQFLLIKAAIGNNADGVDWVLFDNMRGIGSLQTNDEYLRTNRTYQSSSGARVGITPTGFRLSTSSGIVNGSNTGYVYMAIRRPHKPPTAGTDVFAVDNKTAASGSTPQYTSNFPVDLALRRNNINSQDSPEFITRLTHAMQYSNDTNAEISDSSTQEAFKLNFGYNNGFGNQLSVDSTDYLWMFKRAPGFMDVVAYNGSGTAGPIPHNLGAVPQMIIVKRRDSTPHWQHWYYPLGAGGLIQSAGTTPGGASTTAGHWNNTLPTATHFYVGTDNDVNYSYPSWWTDPPATYIAYLFGSLNGISKVGSYSGTGSDVDVDCGFSNGARFVMIKRSDGYGDFYIWDSLRGITSGNDPYWSFNRNTAQTTNTNYINPLSSGFTVNSNAPDALNAVGGEYLFLAIA